VKQTVYVCLKTETKTSDAKTKTECTTAQIISYTQHQKIIQTAEI